VRILGDPTTLSGTEYVDFFARSSIFNSDLGGMRIQRQSTGNIDTSFWAAAAGNPSTEMMRISGNGGIGIGTTNPTGGRLHVETSIGNAVYGNSNDHSGAGAGLYGYSLNGYGLWASSGPLGIAAYFNSDIYVNGLVHSASDARLKQDISNLGYGLPEVWAFLLPAVPLPRHRARHRHNFISRHPYYCVGTPCFKVTLISDN
jgi:hypothetical protein